MLQDFRFRLRALVRHRRVEEDLDDELRFHLDRAVEQHVARGLSPREARRRARLDFGPVDAVKDDCRQSWGIRQIDILRRDLVSALRLIRKHPALSAIAAVSLAIGIGLNTALFALVDATLLRRLPVERPEQLVDVYANDTDGFAWHGSSYPDYLDLRDDLSLNGRVLGLSVAVALGAGVAAGLMPAWTGTRSSVLGGLAVGGSAWSIGGRRWRSRGALVTVQIAVSLVLLVVAGLLARNLAVAGRADPGFSPDAIAAVTVGLGLVGYDDDEAARFLERARDRVRALPGVQAVARATRAPLSVNYMRTGVAPAEGTEPDAAFAPVETAVVGAGYFDALGVPVLAGRGSTTP